MDLVMSFWVFFLTFHLLLLEPNSACRQPFRCGKFRLEFPLTRTTSPSCGLIVVSSCDSGIPKIISGTAGNAYAILEKITPTRFLVQDAQLQDFLHNRNCLTFRNLTLPQFRPLSFTVSPNITLFTCFNASRDERIQRYFRNFRSINYNISGCDSGYTTVYYGNNQTADDTVESGIPAACTTVQLPLKQQPVRDADDDLFTRLTPNFTLEWSVSQGCFQNDSDNQYVCRQGGTKIKIKKFIFIGGMTIASLTSTLIIIFVFIWRKQIIKKQEHEKDIELFLKNNVNLAPMRYKYSSIKTMTNSFRENLGKGGYGNVYKGQLPDGHPVAVKVLNETNGNGEEFMNEVASISRTSHINIVALLGFCFEGSKRALIYDFMPHGSLEKFIAKSASARVELGLRWEKLFEIALGIARGLEYLHQGCNTRILHLDIKPQNILLDKDLNPRISDFGLAKLCPNRSSIVSMLVARGTIGYIAPEVFSRNFGGVSNKSDVYSYGMLILEMVGGSKNIDSRDHTSELYFPHYIYNQLEMDAERDNIGDLGETINDDESQLVKRNLIIVGLWCIQTNPKERPSMTKVVEMLEGKFGSLEVPPKPYLYSPPRSPSTISIS